MGILKIEGISKSFGSKKILDDIQFEISTGLFGLLGSNGVGKTTLMRMIATLVRPDKGTIFYNEINGIKQPDKMRQVLGYLPQEFGGFKNISARECLEYIGIYKGLHDRKRRREEIDQILELVNLQKYERIKIKKFSGGMKRRLGIAQALLGNPQLLIVDEPTAGLDPEERIRFRSLLRSLAQNRTILLSTHIIEDIQATCTGVAVLKDRKIQYFPALEQLAAIGKGKVWEFFVTDEIEYRKMEQQCTIISTQVLSTGKKIRLISETKPAKEAIAVDPMIEEGYIIWNNQ